MRPGATDHDRLESGGQSVRQRFVERERQLDGRPGANSTNKVVFNVPGATRVRGEWRGLGRSSGRGRQRPRRHLIVTNGGSLVTSATNWSAIGYNNTNLMVVESGGSVGFGFQLWIGFARDPTAHCS
jgi:hypothetical protein